MAGNRKQGFLRGNHGGSSQKEIIKSNIRNAKGGFDGCGSPFKTAIAELRKEGLKIIYDNVKCLYFKELSQ